MKKLSIIFFFISFQIIYSQEDTIFIQAHDYVDMDWYGNYDAWANFPSDENTYRKILMHYDMRCSSSGCSGWDYTTKISLMKVNGEVDENGNPVFIHDQTLANVITPYGTYMQGSGSNGFSPNWVQRYTYDVTDFAPLLKDSVLIRAFYGGWSTGFNVTLNFEFIEGTPPRNVLDIQNLWSGSNSYSDIQNILSDTLVFIPQEAKNSIMRVTISGHGQDGEFTPGVDYTVSLNGENLYTQEIWRDDCGEVALYPQGGTWVYDRANWCPGDKATTRDHELTSFIQTGQENLLDFNIYRPNWNPAEASYIYDAQLITFEEPNFNLDAVMEDIISPSNKDEYFRFNPSCSNPIIKIKNQGSQTLNSAEIHYGFDQFSNNIFYWTGNLKFGEIEIIELPPISWNWDNQTAFYANIVAANNIEDEYEVNNMLKSNYEYVEEYPSSFAMWFKTNSYPNESSYEIRNNENELIFSKTGMEANTLYKDTFNLAPGCYKIQILDTGGNQYSNEDGLSWWANDDGSGYARLREVPGGFFKYYQADFGTELTDYFRVGNYFMSNTEIEDILFDVFPNPSNGNFNVFVESNFINKVILKVIDINGKVIKEMIKEKEASYQNFSIKDLPNGIYTILLESENNRMKKNIVVAK
tara:strand:- start:1381 stop:3297 length:1917 start_codon:yes stop_codon:yes gene_type:complete